MAYMLLYISKAIFINFKESTPKNVTTRCMLITFRMLTMRYQATVMKN